MIRFSGVAFAYRRNEPVLRGVDLELPPGLTLLLGRNGCGKSTLLKLAAGVERPDAGQVTVDGFDLWSAEVAARRSLAYVPEQPDLTPYATVGEVLELVCRLRGEPVAAAAAALGRVELAPFARRSVRELSMGQRRRAVLAAAFIGQPRSVLLDEPLETLDRVAREHVLAWIAGLVAGGAVLAVVSHDLAPFAALAARAVTVSEGRAQVVDPLPADAGGRGRLLERLSRAGGAVSPP